MSDGDSLCQQHPPFPPPLPAGDMSRNSIIHLSFNQDCTCVTICTQLGLQIYNLSAHKLVLKYLVGAIRCVPPSLQEYLLTHCRGQH